MGTFFYVEMMGLVCEVDHLKGVNTGFESCSEEERQP